MVTRRPLLSAVLTLSLAASASGQFTAAEVPDFRGWENTFYAGWNDWSLIQSNNFVADADDPATTTLSARFVGNSATTTLMPTGTGEMCVGGLLTAEAGIFSGLQVPVREVVVQLKANAVEPPLVYLEYLADVPFNPDSDNLFAFDVRALAPGEFLYHFRSSQLGLPYGIFGDFRSFVINMDLSGTSPAGCIDALKVDVRHELSGESRTTCTVGQGNSLNVFAGLDVGGSSVAADNLIQITATGIPSASFGYFLMSESSQGGPCPGNCSNTQGVLCLSGDIARLGPAMLAGDDFTFARPVDLTAVPLNPVATVLAGSTWHFQGWYRDANPLPTSNFTIAKSVLFQ